MPLIAVVCAVIGTVTTPALRSHPHEQWDGQGHEVGARVPGCVQSGLLLTAGSAADLPHASRARGDTPIGRREMPAAGLALFGLGSPAAGLAVTTGQLIAARAGTGIGGALLLTTTLTVFTQIFPPEEHARAVGASSAVSALGFAGGPLIGGFVLDHFQWGAILLIHLPVVALGLIAVGTLVPESRNPQGDRPGLLGAVLSTLGMAALVHAIISGPGHGWTSGRVPATAAVAVVVLALFAYGESRVPYPMPGRAFFRDQRFTGVVAGLVLITRGMGGALFPLTQRLQFVLGYGPFAAGLRTAPPAVAVVLPHLLG